jgi:hypothetical protein
MAQVIVLQNALHTRNGLHPPDTDLPDCATALPLADQREPGKEDVDRAILLLDIAARQARLLVMEINDPSRREYFEAQIATIEQLLHLARSMSLKLE